MWAAIFDWDGVILDSSRQHERAWELVAAEAQQVLPPGVFQRSFGMRNDRVIRELLGWTHDPERIRQLSERKEELFRALIQQERVEPLPGVGPWLHSLRAAGVPCAVATSTPRANLDCVMDRLHLRPFFTVTVTAEEVRQGKPHPEVFLTAAARLGVPPGRCVVFEDAHVGVQAARAAGMKVVGVATTHPADSLRDADRVVQRLDELTVAELAGWFARPS